MNNLGINLQDFQSMPDGGGGFGTSQTSPEQLNDLSKALEAGSITGRETTNSTSGSGSPLKVESLDKTLKLVTFKESDIVLWKKVPKNKAYNTVEEFNQQTGYGDERGGFVLEGELPQEEDSQFVRRAQLVKFLGVVKSVTHVLTLTNNVVGNLIDKASKDGSLWILRRLNRALVYGDSSIVPQEFNGLFAQHAKHDNATYLGGSIGEYLDSDVVVDMRGKILTQAAVEDAQQAIVENFGVGTDIFGPPKAFSNYIKQNFPNFIAPGTPQQGAKLGNKAPGQETDYGDITFNRDIFLRKHAPATAGAAATHPKAPSSPTSATATAAVAVDASSKFGSTDAGDYTYAVRAMNRFGESALVTLGTAASVVDGGAADLTFAAGTGGIAATAFAIYRTKKNDAGKFYRILTLSASELAAGYNGAAVGKVRDLNHFMTDCDQMFLIENTAEVHEFKQLAPLMKMDLAITSPAYRFMVLMYGTPLLYAPKKMVRFINVGNETA